MVAGRTPVGVGLSAEVVAECASPDVADHRVPLNAPAPVPSLVKVDAARQPLLSQQPLWHLSSELAMQMTVRLYIAGA